MGAFREGVASYRTLFFPLFSDVSFSRRIRKIKLGCETVGNSLTMLYICYNDSRFDLSLDALEIFRIFSHTEIRFSKYICMTFLLSNLHNQHTFKYLYDCLGYLLKLLNTALKNECTCMYNN